MKSFVLSVTMLVLTVAIASGQKLVVHEWGTFTTVQGSDCVMLPGLYLEEEELPAFVYHHGGFSPDTNAKGIYKPVVDAKVKMETPVLYFYSPVSRDVTVNVGFDHGTISQWYPQRSGGDTLGNAPQLDLSKPYQGWIRWNATVLPPDATQPYSAPKKLLTPTWTTPRMTDANLIQAGNKKEVEKFLFYRGVGNFSTPLKVCSGDDNTLTITNTGAEAIPYVFIYQRSPDHFSNVWWTGRLDAGETREAHALPSQSSEDVDALMKQFEDALVSAGLYRKEAAAMLGTWHSSYFEHTGLKIFWIVPRGVTDRILPISISPAPDSLERVLVGRSEILMPSFEKQLLYDFSHGRDTVWAKDRYYLAYKERVRLMKIQGTSGVPVSNEILQKEMLVYPNPAGSSYELRIDLAQGSTVRLTMVDAAGREVLALEEEVEGSFYQREIPMGALPAGTYFITLRADGHQWVRQIVKQ